MQRFTFWFLFYIFVLLFDEVLHSKSGGESPLQTLTYGWKLCQMMQRIHACYRLLFRRHDHRQRVTLQE
jgi:hypothetical protein